MISVNMRLKMGMNAKKTLHEKRLMKDASWPGESNELLASVVGGDGVDSYSNARPHRLGSPI
jgi:hypothetical protein